MQTSGTHPDLCGHEGDMCDHLCAPNSSRGNSLITTNKSCPELQVTPVPPASFLLSSWVTPSWGDGVS